ncbi:MAG: aminopeptidase P N-terminal domain-containing protein [Bryobacteraceae bacterium]
MRITAGLVCLGLLAADHGAVLRARRDELRKALPGCAVVLEGGSEPESGDLRGFFQEPNFAYLSGWAESNAALLIDPEREVLFLPSRIPDQDKWKGPRLSPVDPEAPAKTGFGQVMALEVLEREIRSSLERAPKLCGLSKTQTEQRLKALAPMRDVSDARPALARLRMKKSPEEVARIRHATDVTIRAHRAAWKRLRAGLFEYQLAATLTAQYLEAGCERTAFMPIIGSGSNGVLLHHSRARRRIDQGELVVIDSGAECGGYASDVARTVPVGGRFSKRQREIYDVVLGAHRAVLAALKPGATLGRTSANSLYRIALDYIDSHGSDREGRPLGRYFAHGIGHHVGLDVHDAEDPAAPLEPGMVITVEPGVYLPDEKLGVRIEDVVLVTQRGAEVMSAALPVDSQAIERALARLP